MRLSRCSVSIAVLLILVSGNAKSQVRPDLGKLLATSGVIQVEGAGGGGLVPWALISGYGTRDSYGANVHATVLRTQDYALTTHGMAIGFADQVEMSLAKQRFKGTDGPLDNVVIGQDILGLKMKVAGNAVYGQNEALPQIAIGLMAKRHTGVRGLAGVDSIKDLGAKSKNGIDYYVAATKLLLEHRLLLNGTLRATRANQMGLLGFGGDARNRYQIMPEVSAGFLINRSLVVGAEYRAKPHHNLRVDNEKDYYDTFIAYFPTKNISVTAAYVALGDITVLNPKQQHGTYLSLQVGF